MPPMAGDIDFEAEGLLGGLEGDARQGRLQLLGELHTDGVSLDELHAAVEEDRLTLLPAERALRGGEAGMTAREIAKLSGVPLEMLLRQRQALGVPIFDPDAPDGTQADLEAAKRIKVMLDAGVSEDGLVETARVMGLTMSQVAAASRGLMGETLREAGATESELAQRFVFAATELQPRLAAALDHALQLHLREQLRHDALNEVRAGGGSSTRITAGFADLVGFSRLGEQLPIDELGALGGRLNELAADVANGPVRLVKLIGDAAMLVSTDPDALLEAILDLVAAADSQDDDFPPLRAGVASGDAIARGGDWYGPPVNIAARITAMAYASSVLAAESVTEEAGGDWRWSFAGERKLKGMKEAAKLFRVRRPETGG